MLNSAQLRGVAGPASGLWSAPTDVRQLFGDFDDVIESFDVDRIAQVRQVRTLLLLLIRPEQDRIQSLVTHILYRIAPSYIGLFVRDRIKNTFWGCKEHVCRSYKEANM